MDYKQLKGLLLRHECGEPETHLTACITFASFGPGSKEEYPWNSRTYLISSDNKAFQPGKGGYSIFGSCLDGADRCLRLYGLMAAERGGKDGWIVEDCGIVGYLLIECSDFDISAPKLFYSHDETLKYMLSQLAEMGELDAGLLQKDYAAAKELLEEGCYGAGQDHAWLADPDTDWHWKIQPVCIYDPLKMVFPDLKDKSCLM